MSQTRIWIRFLKWFSKKGSSYIASCWFSVEASFLDDMCGRNKTKNFLSFLPHMSFVKSSRRPALVPEVLRVSCKTLKSLGEKSLEFWLKVLGVLSDPPGASRHTPGRMCPHAQSHPPIRPIASARTPCRIRPRALSLLRGKGTTELQLLQRVFQWMLTILSDTSQEKLKFTVTYTFPCNALSCNILYAV